MPRTTAQGRRTRRPAASPQALTDPADSFSAPPSNGFTRTTNTASNKNGRTRRKPQPAFAEETGTRDSDTALDSSPDVMQDSAAKTKRRRGSRGGRRHRKSGAPAPEGAVVPVTQPVKEPAKRASRSRATTSKAKVAQSVEQDAAQPPRQALTKARARIPVTGAPTEEVPAPFAHNAEYEFARILDFYGIDWQYEPRSFPLRWDRGHVTEAFTPDFYLSDLNLYVELTTLKTSLTAEKNRKMRLVKEIYPEVNIIMLKKRDYLRLLAKYGYGPLSPGQVPEIDRVLLTATKIQQRVGQLGAQISRDYAGKEPVLVGVLRGVMCFISDLMRHISVPTAVDLMAVSSYEGNGAGAVRILKDLDENIKGRDVILIEDIVDTGMTLNHVIDYLQTKRPASIRICTLLDKRARRIVNVPLDYVAFEIPDEFVVGYGLDFHQRFRNLPFIAVLKHDLLP
jgi:hypoxanthine phosphoribosyltransferase